MDDDKVIGGRTVEEIIERFEKKIKDPRDNFNGSRSVKIIKDFLKLKVPLGKSEIVIKIFLKKNNLKIKNINQTLSKFNNLYKKLGSKQNITFDAKFGRETQYYTGLAFSVYNQNKELETKLFHSFDLVGESQDITKVKKIINKLSSSESRVLITGPTGSGKELVARKIHKNSSRQKEPFIILNAALLKEKTYEKELFGEEFEDGNISFGALERANKGTLLIDEVSEIPYETQANVLRVLIDQKFKRINGTKDINVNIRLISSTSKNLNKLIIDNIFREDLFHRLNVMPIELTPLSSRTEDIPLLIKYFKTKLSEINGVQEPDIDIKNDSLYTYNWPGNVRELRNLVERITILSSNESKQKINKLIDDILNPKSKTLDDNDITNDSFQSPLKEAREHFEKEYLSTQLKKHHGNVSKTADFIGMERSALHRKLKSLGIKGIN